MLKILEEYQGGKSLYEISKVEGMPTYMTLMNWRFRRPDFFYILKGSDEDRQRRAAAKLEEVTERARSAVMAMTTDEMIGAPSLVNTAISGLDKLVKSPGIDGDAPPELQEEQNDSRKRLEALHPITQEKIRKALIEDARMRGEEEEE